MLNVNNLSAGLIAVANTADAGPTQLETAYDGLVYYVNTSGRLKTIDPCTDGVLASPVATVLSKNSGMFPQTLYLLPDQRDDENDALASGMANPTIGKVRVDMQTLSTTVVGNVYNCNALTLSVSIVGAVDVQVTLTPTNSAGTPTGSAVCSTGWRTGPPEEIKSMCEYYLANAANAGYYQLKIEARGLCGQITTFTGRILVSALTAASAGFQFNPCSGILVDPTTTSQAVPAEVGVYAAGINLSFSTGMATSYQVKFEQYDTGSGTLVPIGNFINIAGQPSGTAGFSYLANLAGLGAGYFTPGNPGYNKIHRITLTLANQCGVSAPLTGYFRPSNLSCRSVASTGPVKPAVSVFPNPLGQGTGHVTFTLPRAQRASLSIVDGLTGQEKMLLLRDAPRPAGSQTLEFDAATLPAGVYLYRLVTDEVQVGRILKTE